MDTSREIRAMIMASFPSPPLPLTNGGNSHDLIAYLIDVVARRMDPAEDKIRKDKQDLLCLEYCEDVVNCTNETELFNCMTRFNREYMLTYFPIMHEIRFLPFDSIKPPLKKLLCSWIASQKILQGIECSGEEFEHLHPVSLYFLSAEVIKKANSPSCLSEKNSSQNGNSIELE